MRHREFVWSETGLAMAAANKVEPVEVSDAYAPDGMRLERVVGDLLVIVMGMADTGRVIAVLCERVAGQNTAYKIMGAKALSGEALDEWRRRLRWA